MEVITRSLPILLLLLTSTLGQYEGLHGYDDDLSAYSFKPLIPHQNLEHHDDYDVDYHAHPKYAFDYSVKDPHTGDNKDHWETRDGDKVKGSYTLIETDGTKRVVEYEADDKNGFNAVVHKIGTPIEHEHKPLKPVFEPVQYHEYNQHEYKQLDDGFVPIVGYGH